MEYEDCGMYFYLKVKKACNRASYKMNLQRKPQKHPPI